MAMCVSGWSRIKQLKEMMMLRASVGDERRRGKRNISTNNITI
jgi:hypothetical protein